MHQINILKVVQCGILFAVCNLFPECSKATELKEFWVSEAFMLEPYKSRFFLQRFWDRIQHSFSYFIHSKISIKSKIILKFTNSTDKKIPFPPFTLKKKKKTKHCKKGKKERKRNDRTYLCICT